MEYNIIKDNMTFNDILYEAGTEQNIDAQLNLPEYCADVERILKCLVIPNIFACQITGDRVTADGDALIRVIYVSDKGTTECYEQSVPFSKYIEIRDLNNECNAMAKAAAEYVNCRAVSPRRLSVNGNINIHFCVTSLSSVSLTASAEGCGVQTKNETVNADIPVGQCKKLFEIGETVAVEQNEPPISAIIKSDAFADIDSVKCIANKMLIKGEMIVDFLYKADDNTGDLIHLRHTMPLSQIVEIVGIDEESLCDCVVTVSCVNAVAKTDSSGENRLIDLSVKSFVCVDAYENKDVTLVTDSYSTEYDVKCESKNVELVRHIYCYDETKPVRATVDASSLNISEIKDISCRKVEGSAAPDGEKVGGVGNAVLGILYKNTDGDCGYTERTVDFTFECQGKRTDERICAEPNLCVCDASASTVGSDKLEIKFNVKIYMPIIERIKKRVCTDIQPDESRPKSQNGSALTIYFSSPGESLWDIAQRYNTTVNAIKEENDLSQDVVSEKMMLMIPKA